MDSKFKKTLYKNLSVISELDPTLDARIRWPIEQEHITLNEKNEPIYNRHNSWFTFHASSQQINDDLDASNGKIILFGVGFGEYIRHIFDSNPDADIIAWERDPAVLRFLFMHHDFSMYIKSGKLRFILGVDLIQSASELKDFSIIYHPFFSQIYTDEIKGLQAGFTGTTVALALGGLFVEDMSSTLSRNGYLVWPIDLERWSKEELRYTLLKLNPQFLASINYIKGTAEFCERQKLPYICWEIDPNMDSSLEVKGTTQFSHIFTYRKTNKQTYTSAGFKNVEYLPLASNTEKRAPSVTGEKVSTYQAQLTFVGRSMVEEASYYRKHFVDLYKIFRSHAIDSESECEEKIQSILDKQLEDGSQFLIPQLFDTSFSDFQRYLQSFHVEIDPIKILSQIAAAERRLYYVASLGKYGINVWGDDNWQCVEEYGATYKGKAGHEHQLPQIYNGSAINIDIGRLYQLDIVTMRVFDVLACGGFLIAEYSDDLAELFKLGEELEHYKTLEELEEKITYYQANPVLADNIAKKGLQAVRDRHNFQVRFEYMMNSMKRK